MAFTTLGIRPPPLFRRIRSREDLQRHIEASKLVALAMHNSTPGLLYHFEDLELQWSIVDEPALRRTYEAMGMSQEHIELRIEWIRSNPLAVNFGAIRRRFEAYKEMFDAIFPGKRSASVDVAVTFETLFDAGATPLEDGTDVLTISSGMFNFERWFHLRQLFDEVCPLFVRSEKARTLQLTPEHQRLMRLALEGMHNLSRIMFRLSALKPGVNNKDTREQAMHSWHFLTVVERAMLEEPRPLEQRRSEERSAEAFMLCHELGHIDLDHTSEVREWQRDDTSDPVELERRIQRRRQMEHDADAYATGGMARIVRWMRKKQPRVSSAEIMADPDAHRDYILPIIDFFTIMEMGQKGAVDFDTRDCPYPSNYARLHLLGNSDPANPDYMQAWQQMQFFAAYETSF